MGLKMFIVSLIIITILTFVDQIIKLIVVNKIAIGEVVKVIRFGKYDIFSLTHITNNGAAWNVMSGKTWFLVGLPTIVIAVAIFYMFKKRKDKKMQMISISMIIAGGLGNLIDRIRVGEVVDYILFEPVNFPIFNFADICIVIGAILFAIYVLFIEESKSRVNEFAEVEKIKENDNA